MQKCESNQRGHSNSVSPSDSELAGPALADIVDVSALKDMMNHFYAVTNMGVGIIDTRGNVLVKIGWQDICTQFHRVNPQTCKNCVESDVRLSGGVQRGKIRLYKCKNNMWDVVTPIYLDTKRVGNVFFGQFFFDDEQVDRSLFEAQAEKYGFDKAAYLAAFERIPRYSRQKIKDLMMFYLKMGEMISQLSFTNVELHQSLCKQKRTQKMLQEKATEVEEYASRMEELAHDRAERLKHAERLAAIGATAGMVGHDIRNPLQSITSDVYLAKSELSTLPNSEQKQFIEENLTEIGKAVEYVNKIVADLQDYSRSIRPVYDYVNLEELTDEVVLKSQVPGNVRVIRNVDRKAQKILTDRNLLKRILTNLVTNAHQAMPLGGTLAIRAWRANSHVLVSVQDTGMGIPNEAKAKLFTPLFTTKSKGQGFGLAVVKRLTESLNGEVYVRSAVGKGSTFTLSLPYHEPQAAQS